MKKYIFFLLFVLSLSPSVRAQENITTFAGNGSATYAGDGGQALSASFNQPQRSTIDDTGNMYIADMVNQRIRKISPMGVITTIAGTGVTSFSGDGGLATSATFNFPNGVYVDVAGNVYVSDHNNHRIRKIDTSGNISTFAGNGSASSSGDGGLATSASIHGPTSISSDATGNIYICEWIGNRIRKVNTSGIITTVAGTGAAGYTGDGGLAASATLNRPTDIFVDDLGNLFIPEMNNDVVRKVNTSGIITTIAGTGAAGYTGDGGLATSATLNDPWGVFVDVNDNLFIAEHNNNAVRKVNLSTNIISTFAGTGGQGFSGDGGVATSAQLNRPVGVTGNANGEIFISDQFNHRIRKVAVPQFTETATIAGVDHSANTGGIGWGDYDNDGDLDLYLANFTGANAFYRNNNDGTFSDIASIVGLNSGGVNSAGIAWADYDNDGDSDIYLTDANGSNSLFRNNGGTFSNEGASAGVSNSGPGHSAAWADYDNDGHLDLYVTNSIGSNLLYRNLGNSTFSDVASGAGVNDGGASPATAWADYDGDGDLDLYVTKTNGTDLLYQNSGGTFTNVAGSVGINNTGKGYGIAWADYDNDGDLDLYVPNESSPNNFYRNDSGSFSEIGNTLGVNDSGIGHGGAWADYDNDGDQDLFTSNSNGSQVNLLYKNTGGNLSDIASSVGLQNVGGGGRSSAWADYDNDGDVDLYVVASVGNNRLYRNNGTSNNYLVLKMEGTVSNRSGIGAVITVVTGISRQRRDVDGGSGFLTQPSLSVEFGIGTNTTVDSLIVQWPSGITFDTTNVSTNQILSLTEQVALSVMIPDTTSNYASTIDVPIRIEGATGKGIVAAEINVAYDARIITSSITEITNTLVASGWSVEENILQGSGDIDTLAIAMSTAQDTLNSDGDLLLITFQTANIRHPDSTALTLTKVLFNDGTPLTTANSGSLKLIGTSGAIIALPDSINPGNAINIIVTDTDHDLDVGNPDQVSATAISKLYNDTQTITLTETGANTGVFTGSVNTAFALAAGPSNDGVITTLAGDSICVSYVDSLTASGATLTRQDTVEVIGGVDGVVSASYVVQALDARNGVRDTVRVQVTDTDLDLDVGVAEQVSATITNAISGESESVTLIETGVNTGVFQIRVPSIAGASGTNNDGILSLASWDTLNVSYTDSLTSQGGVSPVSNITRVVNAFGDVQANDQIQAFDAARLLAISVGLVSANTQTTLVGDVDGWGAIQAFDASLVLQYVVRLIDRFPVQTDFVADPKNHPFEKPVVGDMIALGEISKQADGTHLVPVRLTEREGILSGTLTFDMDESIEIIDVILANDYSGFLSAHNTTEEGLKVAFAGSQSKLNGSGDVLMLKVRGISDTPLRLSLDHVILNGQTLTPTINIETIEAVNTETLITKLHQNVPNPFNPETTIRYDLLEASDVQIIIYNVMGQQIHTLISEYQAAGIHHVTWNAKDALGRQVSSGVYFIKMDANTFSQTRKMLLLR